MAGDDRGQGAEDRPASADLPGRAGPRLRPDRPAEISRTWVLTVRAGPKTTRSRFEGLEPALGAVEAQARELTPRTPTRKRYRFEPQQQVVARLELAGPGIHAGLDIHGDGSQVAFTGRFRRRPIETREAEAATGALRRVLTGPA